MKIDMSKYPRLAAMLARRGPNYQPSTVAQPPMKEISKGWEFDANGVRKSMKKDSDATVDLTLPF
jgi:hypothetical protein